MSAIVPLANNQPSIGQPGSGLEIKREAGLFRQAQPKEGDPAAGSQEEKKSAASDSRGTFIEEYIPAAFPFKEELLESPGAGRPGSLEMLYGINSARPGRFLDITV